MFPSAISSWALLIAKALESYGINSQTVFQELHMDATKLRDPNARYPAEKMAELWKRAAELTGNPCIGLKAAEYWHPTTMHALGFAWMASSTLKEALERVVRYVHIVNNAALCELRDTREGYRFVLGSEILRKNADAGVDAGMATMINMCRSSYGPEFNPTAVFLSRSEPACNAAFADFFRAPVHYQSPENALLFDKAKILGLLPTANAELAQANEKIIAEYLANLDKRDISTRVKRLLINELPSGQVEEQRVADALHLSLRNMQRKLAEQGTTYKQILEGTRRDLALQYIMNSRYSITEISYLLGFAEPGNFSRAFKRWTGEPPKAYRAQAWVH